MGTSVSRLSHKPIFVSGGKKHQIEWPVSAGDHIPGRSLSGYCSCRNDDLAAEMGVGSAKAQKKLRNRQRRRLAS